MEFPARRLLPAVAAAALLMLSACTSSGGGGSAASSAQAGGAAASPTVVNDLQTDYENTVKAVLPSIVQINAENSLGTGIVYDTKGDIVTNAHVVGTATSFQVLLSDQSNALAATLVASYPANDLAVIKLTKPPAKLTPAVFGDTSQVSVGQIVLAMGSPLGLSSSVTQGIVSATGRTVSEAKSEENPQGTTIPNMVQTSAAINPGNSGGALVNLSNQVIGVNTLAAVSNSESGAQAPGIGFAIPSSSVTNLADQMIKYGKVVDSGRAALGVTVRTVLVTNSNGSQTSGAGVVSVTSGGPADKGGIQSGDVITKLADTPIDSSQALSTALATLKPGQQVTVTYLRDGASRTAKVTLGTLS
ncbi:S1C family serine protease [Streptacidiphilus jiangxiensis]|uniref:Serine protease, S1-C subfamily, contains C-terminal PDZ domain n=1 Tax=Streptacidiphilus jiangxiensis TaxID=235985 RepID=A0A1H7LZH6_STRJI|nr:trypsin-like peptidase domain-containing protein [Streptacidiphilus jiangxiensis]SEL04334.1 serine protease, S1-C subfamily, contains C-terminal PDZ domain [Streptacidiphilus jiangxiensis]